MILKNTEWGGMPYLSIQASYLSWHEKTCGNFFHAFQAKLIITDLY